MHRHYLWKYIPVLHLKQLEPCTQVLWLACSHQLELNETWDVAIEDHQHLHKCNIWHRLLPVIPFLQLSSAFCIVFHPLMTAHQFHLSAAAVSEALYYCRNANSYVQIFNEQGPTLSNDVSKYNVKTKWKSMIRTHSCITKWVSL